MQFIQGMCMTSSTQNITFDMRTQLTQKINKLPMGFFHGTSTGDVLSRMTNDVDTIGDALQRSIVQLVSSILTFLGTGFMMFKTNWTMAIVAILASIVGIFSMGGIMGKSQKYFKDRQKYLGLINGHIEENYSGHEIVKTYNGEIEAKKTFSQLNEKLFESNFKSMFLSGLMQPLMGFVGNFGYVAVCVTGALLAINNVISFGVIVAFIVYVRMFTQPLNQIAQTFTSLQSATAATERVFDFLQSQPMADEEGKLTELKNIKGDVVFENVKFGYNEDKIIIHNLNQHVLPGQKVAIVGPTGAGKTTIVNLLMKFYELNSGSIKIDGVPLSEMKRETVHDIFGMVLQDSWLFEGTIFENIAYSKTNATAEEVQKAAKAVGLDYFIKGLPKGYDTVLDDKVSLSSGQKQLMTIARAMVENAPLLILDEATSSVDTRTEELIQKAMDQITQGRTSFVIAHRLSTIRNAALILVLKDGDVIESGTHQQLMAQGGFYKDLYNSQFETI